MFAQVAIPKTILETLTYAVPEKLNTQVKVGSLVKVPLRKKMVVGIVIDLQENLNDKHQNYEIKDIDEVIHPDFLDNNFVSLLSWIKRYYFVNWGQMLNLAIPQEIYCLSSKNKNSIDCLQSKATGRPKPITYETSPKLSQNSNTLHQFAWGLSKVSYQIKNNRFRVFLLFNPNGVDLTELYLKMIEEAVRLKKSAIILVPEINLTAKFIALFQSRLFSNFFCLHSGLKRSERKHIWWQIQSSDFSVVLGTRTAIFAPVKNLGLLIVDNEQDVTYKEQERLFHYNARDIALVRGQKSEAVVILSSATPSCESFYNAEIKKYELIMPYRNLEKRKKGFNSRTLLIDMRRSRDKVISSQLRNAIISNCRQNRLVVLFLNRLGYARILSCNECGYIPLCPNCGISLTYHREKQLLLCHICQSRQPIFDFCPQCKGSDFFLHGFGSEKVESEVKKFINPNNVLRYDSDVQTQLKDDINQIICERNIKVFVTTKLGIRNLDFSNIGLVGIILADTSLFLPDFRAQERTFQELRQIIITSLHNPETKVIIQSYHPDHPALCYAVQADYKKFYNYEIKLRQKLNYPPFSRLALISISSNQKEIVLRVTENLTKRIVEISSQLNMFSNGENIKKAYNQKFQCQSDLIKLLGPSLLSFTKGPYRFTCQILIKLKPNLSLSNLISKEDINSYINKDINKKDVKIDINIDPI
ncbi:MAG: primosomal protein N' [candidate division WOR-3 bacterium]|nr:primosomal protein N' [candidate division WOR-3 bacterium]